MSETAGPIADIKEEAMRISEAANAVSIPLRLLGGLAIYFQCPVVRSDTRFQRPYKDMDFVTLSKASAKIKALFTDLGYAGNKNFNALHGHQRLLFWDERHQRQIDIFVDRMQMCHSFDFRNRLDIDARTLSISDLLLTKLQIVELNEKDIVDTLALFHDYGITGNEQGIHIGYITGLTSNDWGLYKTLETNLKKMKAYAGEHGFPAQIPERIDSLLSAIEAHPKSFAWRTRAMVGERVRWYELPEDPR